MSLHRAGKAFTDGDPRGVDPLACQEMIRLKLVARCQQVFRINTEFRQLALRLHAGLREMTAHGLGGVFHLTLAQTQLHRSVAIGFLGAHGSDLQPVHLQHGDRHMGAIFRPDAGHAQFLSDNAGSHRSVPRVRA